MSTQAAQVKTTTVPTQNKKEKPTIIDIIRYLKATYKFKYNLVTTQSEIYIPEDDTYVAIDDYALNSIAVKSKIDGYPITKADLDMVLHSDQMETYDPFVQYFSKLPKRSGTKYIDQLIATVKTHNTDLFRLCFTKWVVASVASMLDPDVINHQCIIFSGAQNIGKSTWINNLIPETLQDYGYKGGVKLNDKDTKINLSTKFLINLDELINMSHKNSKELKEMITKPDIDLRQVFKRYAKRLPRRASFIGSVNDETFLFDITGNRRFLCFMVEGFANGGRHNINMDRVYAEAYQLYRSGYQYWIDMEEQKIIEENNKKFLVVSVEEEKMLDMFSPVPPFEETPQFYYPKHVPLDERNRLHEHYSTESKNKWRYQVNKADKMASLVNAKFHLSAIEMYRKLFPNKQPNRGEVSNFGRIITKHKFKQVTHEDRRKYEVYFRDVKDSPIDWRPFLK